MDKLTQNALYTYIAYNAAILQTIIKQAKDVDIINILERLNPDNVIAQPLTHPQISDLTNHTRIMYDSAVKLKNTQIIRDTELLLNWAHEYKQTNKPIESLFSNLDTFVVKVVNHNEITNQLLFEISNTDTKWTLIPNDFLYTIYKNRLQQTGLTPLGKTAFLKIVNNLIKDYPDWKLKTNCTTLRNAKNMPEDDPIVKRFCMNKWFTDNKDTPSFRGLVKTKKEHDNATS